MSAGVISKVYAIIVTYNGNWESVRRLVAAIKEAGCNYVVVDNGSSNLESMEGYALVKLHGNRGIAHAQNVGIGHVLEKGAEVVLFFDQDSSISPDFVGEIVAPIFKGVTSISAPFFTDRRKGFVYPIVRISKWGGRTKFLPKHSDGGSLITNVAISSGTAVASVVFKSVGMMDEDLFIDYVDTEWCLRCFDKGFSIRVDCSVIMEHSIGDRTISFGFLQIPVHSPYRRYYRIRNSFLLLRMPHVPKLMAMREICFSVLHQVALAVMTAQRREYLRYLILGVWHGLINRKGKL